MKIKKYTFNVLDIIIILITVSVVFGFAFSIHRQEINLILNKSSEAYVVVTVNETDGIDSKTFTKGEKIYLSPNDKLAGKIVKSVDVQEKKYSVVGDGIVLDYGSDNVGVRITLETKVKKDDTGYYLNGSEFISPGSKLNLSIKNGKVFTATVDDITVKE